MKRICSRRDFLFQSGGGISGVALAYLLNQDGLLAAPAAAVSPPTPSFHRPPTLPYGTRHFGPRSPSPFAPLPERPRSRYNPRTSHAERGLVQLVLSAMLDARRIKA